MKSVTIFSRIKLSVSSSCKIVLEGVERIVEKDHLSTPTYRCGGTLLRK